MLYDCVRGMMDVVFSVCIVMRRAVCAPVWKYECFVMQIVHAGRGCKRRPYGRGIVQSRSHGFLICTHECLILFTPS